MRVDFHSHFFPQEYLRRLESVFPGDTSPGAELSRRIAAECRRLAALHPGVSDVEARLAEMDEVGIDVEVLSIDSLDVYFAGADSPSLARSVNDALAEICLDHPARFRALASVPLTDPEAACRELERAANQLRMAGITIATNVNGEPLDAPQFRDFFATVERLGLPVALHPTTPVAIEGISDYGLAPMVGFVYDTAVAVLRLVLSGVVERHPGLRIIVPHLGGMLHYLFARIDIVYDSGQSLNVELEHPPSHYLKGFYYDTVNFLGPALRCAVDMVGSKQLVLGTDYPFFQARRNLELAMQALDDAGLTSVEREEICSGNALRLLRQDSATEAERLSK